MEISPDISLSGKERVAVIMLALGEKYGTSLWQQLEGNEVRDISISMATLGPVRADLIDKLLGEFGDQTQASNVFIGSYETAQKLLTSFLPAKEVGQIMKDIRGATTAWDRLNNVNKQILTNHLRGEHPQTVAVILSKMNAGHAAKVLAALPDSFAADIVKRMVKMDTIRKDVIEKLEHAIDSDLTANLTANLQQGGSHKNTYDLIAEIFNNLDRTTEAKLMVVLEEEDEESAKKIRELMFTFDDLIKITPSGMQALIAALDKSTLALALKGAPQKIRDLFFANIPERARRMLKEDIDTMEPVRVRDVEEVQVVIVQTAKEMIKSGEINLLAVENKENLIY